MLFLIISRTVLSKRNENDTFHSLSDNLIEPITKTLKSSIFIDEISNKNNFFFNRNHTEPISSAITNKSLVRNANKTKQYIINYQQVYGLRYSPSDYGTKYTSEAESDLIQAMSSPKPTKILAPSPPSPILIDNVMKPTPISRIHTAINLIKTRLQNLITLGADSTTKENKIIHDVLTPTKRFLSLFNIVQFSNIPCVGGPSQLRQLQGTCYHKLECIELGGTPVGSCIAGLAVCCVCELKIF